MAVCSPRRLGQCRVKHMGRGERGIEERQGGRVQMIRCSESGDIAVMAACGRSGKGPLGVFCPENGIFHWSN